jgi:hypothetical protein
MMAMPVHAREIAMSRCANCKHWDLRERHAAGATRACLKISRGFYFQGSDDAPNVPLTKLAETVGDYYDEASLRTAADFGCTLWEAKT